MVGDHKGASVTKLDIREYARRGAQARALELRSELESIYRTFPELRRTGSDAAGSGRPARGRRKPMTAAERKAVSTRMRKYWASRRKAKQA